MLSTIVALAVAGGSGLVIAASVVVTRAERKSAAVRDRLLEYLEV